MRGRPRRPPERAAPRRVGSPRTPPLPAPGDLAPGPPRPRILAASSVSPSYRWRAGSPAPLQRAGLWRLLRRARAGAGARGLQPALPCALPACGRPVPAPERLPPTSLGGLKAPGSARRIRALPPPAPPARSSEPARTTASRQRRPAAAAAELGVGVGGGGEKREGAGGDGAPGEAVGWGKPVVAGLSRSSCR